MIVPESTPTLLSVSEADIARALVGRLTAVFQPSRFIVLGFDKEDEQSERFVQALQSEFEKDFGKTVNLTSPEGNFAHECLAPCWILTSPGNSNQLQSSDLIDELNNTQEKFYTISILRFSRNAEVPAHCEKEKRITIDCVTPLAVREARRKFKEDSRVFAGGSSNKSR